MQAPKSPKKIETGIVSFLPLARKVSCLPVWAGERWGSIELFYKLYLLVPRQSWDWASPCEIIEKVRVWGNLHDVCVYVSPLARANGEYVFLPIIDIDASREAPHAACDAAFLLFNERERELFIPVLSGLKGLKLVPNFFLPVELHQAFLVWLRRRQKQTKIQETGAEIDFNPLHQRLDVNNPPQPQRLWGLRGKNNTAPGETAPWVTARPASWEEVARISFEGAEAYKRAVAYSFQEKERLAEEIARWTEEWATWLRPAPVWLIEELYTIKREKELAKAKQDVNFPARRTEKKISLHNLAAYLAEKGYEFKIEDYKIIFTGNCPFCDRRYKAWINIAEQKLLCFYNSCPASASKGGVDLSTWLTDLPSSVYCEKENKKSNKKKLSLSEAIELTNKTISDFIAGRTRKVLLKVDAGVGKTALAVQYAINAAAIEHAIDAAVRDNVTPVISFPNYNLAKEKIKENAEYAFLNGVNLVLIKSRHQPGMCNNLDEVIKAEDLGFDPAVAVCPGCADRKSCQFFRQF